MSDAKTTTRLHSKSGGTSPDERNNRELGAFPLLKYFSLASLAAIAVSSVVLAVVYERLAIRDLIKQEEQHHIVLTGVVANALWPQFSALAGSSATLDNDALKSNPEAEKLHSAVVRQLVGTRVLKVKIYDLTGRTIFSTEARQIGEDKSRNGGFLSARAGLPASELTHRNQFSAFEQTVEDIDVLSSYIPVYRGSTDRVHAVFEIYSDISSLLSRIESTRQTVVLAVAAILLALYSALFLIVRHADTVIRRQRDRVQQLAFYDSLTGLANRELFERRVRAEAAKTLRGAQHAALLFIDLDGFKRVNDTLGHGAGDELLKEVARRIRESSREGDVIGSGNRRGTPNGLARMGGDEFTVWLPELTRGEDAAVVARRLLVALAQPYRLAGQQIPLTASVGIALCPQNGSSFDELVKKADTAMYQAKRLGKNRFRFFSESVNDSAFESPALGIALSEAV